MTLSIFLRVRHHALDIAQFEEVDLFVVELASLLHDAVDKKLFKDGDTAWQQLYQWMKDMEISEPIQQRLSIF